MSFKLHRGTASRKLQAARLDVSGRLGTGLLTYDEQTAF
jgi:hypothetical protein